MRTGPNPRATRIGLLGSCIAIVLTTIQVAAAEHSSPPPAESASLARTTPGTSASTAAERIGTGVPADPAGQPLDLDACTRIAIAENPLLRAAQEGVVAAAESVGVARAAYYPEVGLGARYRRFDTHVFLPSGLPVQETTLGATDDWSARLQVGYSLFDGGARKAESSAATAGLAASEHDAGRVRQNVVFAVHQAYAGVLSAQAARAAALAREARASDHLKLARALKEAGAVPQADVLRAQTESAAARLAGVQAEGRVRTARGDLNTAMGLPADLPISVLAQAQPIEQPTDYGAEAILGRALVQRPELKAAQERVAAAAHRVDATKAIFRPSLRAEMDYGYRDSEFLPEDPDWSAGVSFQVPIFTGYARRHRVARAAAEVRIGEAETEALENQIRQEAWTASSDLAEAYESLHSTQQFRAEAEQSLGFARARYEAGAGTLNDLLDAESMLTQADSAHVAAVLGYRVARALVLRVQGDL